MSLNSVLDELIVFLTMMSFFAIAFIVVFVVMYIFSPDFRREVHKDLLGTDE